MVFREHKVQLREHEVVLLGTRRYNTHMCRPTLLIAGEMDIGPGSDLDGVVNAFGRLQITIACE